MLVSKIRWAALAVGIAIAAGSTGCYAYADEGPGPVVAGGYEPQYYDGYVVYYDQRGAPYYYNNGASYWVPRSYAYHSHLVNHYRTNGSQYHNWYNNGGHRYRTYRRR